MVLNWPIESIGFLFSFLLDARTATDRIFEVFDEQNTIVDPENPAIPAANRYWMNRYGGAEKFNGTGVDIWDQGIRK